MINLFSKSFLKKYWRYKQFEEEYDDDNYIMTCGIFYKPIQSIIDLCNRIYELRLPRHNLNDTFPLDENGYTKVTHSLLLEYGRYYADGPLLFDSINNIKFIAKNKNNLVVHINLYVSRGHFRGITIKNCSNVMIDGVCFLGHWKK